jgi:hypothetical protein
LVFLHTHRKNAPSNEFAKFPYCGFAVTSPPLPQKDRIANKTIEKRNPNPINQIIYMAKPNKAKNGNLECDPNLNLEFTLMPAVASEPFSLYGWV